MDLRYFWYTCTFSGNEDVFVWDSGWDVSVTTCIWCEPSVELCLATLTFPTGFISLKLSSVRESKNGINRIAHNENVHPYAEVSYIVYSQSFKNEINCWYVLKVPYQISKHSEQFVY